MKTLGRPTFRGYVQVTFDPQGHRVELFMRRSVRSVSSLVLEPESYDKDMDFVTTTFDQFDHAVDEALYVAQQQRGLTGKMKEVIFESGVRVFFT